MRASCAHTLARHECGAEARAPRRGLPHRTGAPREGGGEEAQRGRPERVGQESGADAEAEVTTKMPQVTTLLIHLDDTEAHRIRTWSFRNAYPVKWTGGDLNAGGTEFLTESLEIAHNGMTVT